MKSRIGIIILILICLGLGIGWMMSQKRATEQHRMDAETIGALSNKWVVTSGKLDEQSQVSAMYQKDLENSKNALADLTNNFTQVSASYSQVTANLSKTEAELRTTVEEVKKRDSRIAELEGQNQALDKQALDLSTSITNLTVQIVETQRKLAASEGDKVFLTKELKRLTAEKAELERQFNDLKVLRAQVARLKEELSIARRIEWIRRGLFASSEEKGAAKLMGGLNTQPSQVKPEKASYDLNVELNADGTIRVLTPTNKPAPANPPPK